MTYVLVKGLLLLYLNDEEVKASIKLRLLYFTLQNRISYNTFAFSFPA